ncbi:MAG TPA: response regulator [Burkholderiaceae bacterium]|nr:response regulator [Burkholderiaceae bacterium]
MAPLSIFVVEDSETIRNNLVAALEEWVPVRLVGVAESANDAIEQLLAPTAACDLAIVDVMLREGSGVDVLSALKKANSPVKRVVLTNYATPLVRDHCLALGADRVFDKSSEVEALLDYCGSLAAART